MSRRKGFSRPIVGALLLLAIAVGSIGWYSTHIVRPFGSKKRFAEGASSQRLPRSPARASGHVDTTAPNGTLEERTLAITRDLTSAKALEYVLEHDLGLTRPKIAQMIGRRYEPYLNSSGALAAALDAWCFTGPHVVDVIHPGYSSYYGNPMHNVPANAIAPNNALALLGCGFGTEPGSVRMSLDLSGHSYDLPLAVNTSAGTPWGKFAVWVKTPLVTGVTDQTATLSLTDNANRVSTLKVPFIAFREIQLFDSFTHSDLVAVNPECPTATTHDSCGGAPVGDPRWPEGRTLVAVHWKSCCRSVDGTDTYHVKLSNGWTAQGLDPYLNRYPQERGSVLNWEQGGVTTCWWFGNEPGWAGYWGVSPSPLPDFTFQVQFIWHVDSVCSAAHYAGNLWIAGPTGVPYW
jgi:hypothetical protein